MPENGPQGKEQRTMLTFAQAADQLVKDGIVANMTPEGLRRLARNPSSGWPIKAGDYGTVAGARTLPYELLAPFIRSRKRGRGPKKNAKDS